MMTPWLNRQRALADFTLAALGRRKVKNTALVVVFALVVFVLASAMFFAASLRHETAVILADAPELTVQRLVMGRQDLIGAEAIDQIAAIRGVRGAQGRLWGYFFDQTGGANYTVMVPLDAAEAPPPGQVAVGEGVRRARAFSYDAAPLFLSRHAGDLQKFRVARSFTRDSALMTSDLVLMNEADFRAFFGIPEGKFTDIVATIRNPNEVAKIIEKASYALPDMRFIARADLIRTYQKIFDWREGLLVTLAGIGLLAFTIFAADKASGLSAEEMREIGILKAIGWDTRDVIAMKLWEGGLVSLGAYLLGCTLAYLHVFAFDGALFAPVMRGWAVIYPEFQLTPQIAPLHLMTLLLLTVVPYVAATLVPIWRAASADPDAIMR